MKIIGIDPGTITLGYSVIESIGNRLYLLEAGTLDLKNSGFKESIEMFNDLLNSLLIKYEKIDSVAIETIFFKINPQSLIKLAQFRGALLYILFQKFDTIGEYAPMEIKKSVTGNGSSSKEQVQFMVYKLLNLKPTDEKIKLDITDAIAIAITHFQKTNF